MCTTCSWIITDSFLTITHFHEGCCSTLDWARIKNVLSCSHMHPTSSVHGSDSIPCRNGDAATELLFRRTAHKYGCRMCRTSAADLGGPVDIWLQSLEERTCCNIINPAVSRKCSRHIFLWHKLPGLPVIRGRDVSLSAEDDQHASDPRKVIIIDA